MALTITVLFTDLVDSTALLSRVGEEAAEELRREHFSLLRGGFGPRGGDEVKNLGDGLMVVFPSAADAVAAAVAVQQAFEKRNRRAAEPMSIRVGIAIGDADVEDGDYFGVPVVQAARLCGVAGGDEILITDMVRLLVGARGGFTFEAVGDLALKGLDESVPACRVCWEPLAAMSSPLPLRLASAVAPNFVGRRMEHERLQAAWKEASALAGRRVVLLSGEPGIGKTTLTARFASEVHEEGATVVYGRCDEDLGVPYQPWIEALRQLVAIAPQDVLVGHVAEAGGHLARLVPELTSGVELAPSGGDGESERFVLFSCVADLLERVTGEIPVLLVLDDLHWADRQSVQLVRHVLTCGRPMRLMVLGTFRDSDAAANDPITELLATLHREQGVERLALVGLGDDDLLTMLEQIAGHEMVDEGLALRDAVLEETAGNPFFVGEILRHLAETGAIYRDDAGRWVGGIDLRAVGLPVSVKEVVGRRLAALGPDVERVLSFAAVIGRDFDVTLLSAVTGVDEDAVIDVCDAGVAAAVLAETDQPDRYTFAHALIEHTLYDSLSPARRLRAHHAVAEQLEALDDGHASALVSQLAHHWSAALRPADTAKAIHYAMLAGAGALDQLAPDDAIRWYASALELVDRDPDPDPRRRSEILLGLGDAQRQGGIAAHRETLLEAAWLADGIDAVDLLVRAALTNTRMYQSSLGNTDHDRVAVLARALARLPDTDSSDRARLLVLHGTERSYELSLAERMAIAHEAIGMTRRLGDPAASVFVLHVATSLSGATPQTLDTCVAWAAEACQIADRSGVAALRAGVHERRILVAMTRGDLEAVRRHVPEFLDLVDRVPHATLRWHAAQHRVWLASLAGDPAEAERLADAALELGIESGQPDAMTVYAGQIAQIRYDQGRLHELVPLIEQQTIDAPALVVYRAGLALACARGADGTAATSLLDDALAADFVTAEDQSWTTAMACWAEATCIVGHHEAAAVLRERIEPFNGHVVFSNTGISPALAHSLGRLDHLLGRYDEADAWFAQADAIHRRLEAPVLVAQNDVSWAALLADRARDDDLRRARALATSALDAAEMRGCGYVESDARAVLARLG